jgi:hypothetical protein
VALVILYFHSTTLATTSLHFAQNLARYFQTLVIFKISDVSKVSIALVAVDPNVVVDARLNGGIGIARRVSFVLRTSLATFIKRREHVGLGHSRRQFRDGMIMLTVIQQVDPLGCG